MNISWSDLGAEGQRIATEHFVARSLETKLWTDRFSADDETVVETAPRPLGKPSFAELYSWVTDPDYGMPREQQDMVQADPVLRRNVALLVGRVGQLRAVAAAAASSGGLDVRSGAGFTVRLSVSRAEPAQTYLLLEIDPSAMSQDAPPTVMLVLRNGVPIGKVALPDGHDGSVQLIEASDGAVVHGIRAADTELVLV